MKILVCGDKHLKITRFEKSKLLLDWLNKTIEEVKPDIVVALGDDMDTHAVLRSELMSEFRNHVDFVTGLNIPLVYVVGNHDYHKPGDTTYHALQSMKGIHKYFHVIDKPTTLFDMMFVPFINNIKDFPTIKEEICFAHQTFVGADYGYYRPDIGVDAEKTGAKLIISGHIHRRQMFNNVIYPGSPYATSVNDIDQEKGIMLFDTNTYNYSFIPSPFPKWRSVKFTVDKENTIDMLHQTLNLTINDKDNWVLQLEGPKVELTSYLGSKEYLKMTKGKKVTTKLQLTDNLKKNIEIKSLSVVDIIKEYIDKVYLGSFDKSELYAKALKIINNK